MTSRFLQLSLQAQKNSGYLANRLFYQFVTPLTTPSHIFVGYHGLKLLSTWHNSTRKHPKMWICLFCDKKKHQNTCTGDCTGLHKSIFGVKVEEVWLWRCLPRLLSTLCLKSHRLQLKESQDHEIKDVNIQTIWNSSVLMCILIVINYIRI